MGVEPTKLTALMRSSSSIWSTASLSPFITLKTPSGSPASLSSFARKIAQLGSRSEGFKTKVLPHTMASGNIQRGTMAGKLNGVIPATTPRGWNSLQESMLGPTFLLCSPFNNWGAPQANSTFSIPRCNSPAASWLILPCSAPINAIISSACSSSKLLNLNITRARLLTGVLRHSTNAFCALTIASFTVAFDASKTSFSASPVAGL